ncbi:hypothetical protein AB0D46_36370, partial [Streptomyces sp. NPDC048383]|uniref:hypothetical protein n=1 Tax=Streptomyces sp. NPDC048383 TaxID=3155386 RepID=UPI003415CB1C
EVPAFEFDFSHIGKDWSDGPSGMDDAEQQRRTSILLGLIPGIGDAKGVIEAVTAKDALNDRACFRPAKTTTVITARAAVCEGDEIPLNRSGAIRSAC